MRPILSSIPLIGLCALVGPLDLRAQQCRNENLRGSYGLFSSGVFATPGGFLPFVRISGAEFDGAGNLKGAALASYGGQILTDVFTGGYAVDPDCTVSFTAILGPPFNLPIFMAGVLSDHFTRLDFMTVNPPEFIGIGRIRKQRLAKCTQASLAGRFQLDLFGQVLQPSAPPVQFARFGILVADGVGNFTAKTHVNNNGAVAQEDFSGTYTVDSNCNLNITYGGVKQLSGVLFDGGDGVVLLQVNPAGAVIGGSLTRASRP